jgi:tetratricopeptide (TPR) repeat protein
MFRSRSIPLFVFSALIPFAAACRSDRSETTSESSGASTPIVSAATPTGSSETTGSVSPAVPVTYEHAELAFGAGHYPEATQLFTAYTDSNPENPWGYYMLGLSAWRSGDREAAAGAFDRALQLDPSHRKSLFNSSRVLLELGQPKEALDRIEKALTLEPMSNEGLRLLGRARYQLGQVDEAVAAYQRALGLDDRDVWSMNNLGLIYIDQDRSSEALPPLARAVELRSNAPVFQNNLGMALERSGHPTAAAKAYEAAIALDSTYRKASASLARITAVTQEPDSETVDLAALAQQFQTQVEGWRGSREASDSTAIPGDTVTDSSKVGIVGLSDSSVASVEAVSDTSKDCEQE